MAPLDRTPLVLLLIHDAGACRVYVDGLVEKGWRVVSCTSELALREQLEETAPDLVLVLWSSEDSEQMLALGWRIKRLLKRRPIVLAPVQEPSSIGRGVAHVLRIAEAAIVASWGRDSWLASGMTGLYS